MKSLTGFAEALNYAGREKFWKYHFSAVLRMRSEKSVFTVVVVDNSLGG